MVLSVKLKTVNSTAPTTTVMQDTSRLVTDQLQAHVIQAVRHLNAVTHANAVNKIQLKKYGSMDLTKSRVSL